MNIFLGNFLVIIDITFKKQKKIIHTYVFLDFHSKIKIDDNKNEIVY